MDRANGARRSAPVVGERQGERDARPGAAVRPVADPEPAAMGLDQPTADEQPKTGARDP
jgi:hypothetical protein